MNLVWNLVVVLVFAWVVRGLLAAREVTWPRLLLGDASAHARFWPPW